MKTIILTMALGMLVACQSKQNVEDFNANSDSMMTEVDLAKPKLESIEYIEPQVKMEETEPENVPAIPPPPAPIGKPASKSNHQKPIERQIIKNARLSFQVNNLNASSKRIEQIVKNFDGIIVLSEETHQDNELRQSLDVRVPAIKLDSFLVLLLKESIYTERKSISVEDVTKQYVDLNARIRSKLATENKYLELLKKAQNIKDVLTIEEQLSTMREEIEVKQSELIALKNDVAMSTVWANFYQKTEGNVAPEKSFFVKMGDSTKEGFTFLSTFVLGIMYYFPLIAVLGFLGWLVFLWRKKNKK